MPPAPPTIDAETLTASLKTEALRLGFSLAGVCPAVTPTGIHQFQAWVEAGYAGEMHYLADRQSAWQHPRGVLDGARSILMLATNYLTEEPRAVAAGQGRVSRYGWGRDYHDTLHERLHQLADFHRQQLPTANVRGVVDTAPLAEREFARMAGLGWIGKNTLLLNKHLGSWFFLSALLTDADLVVDTPHESDHCGTCRACLDACPTDAFVDAGVLDARRCISYLNIELRGLPPADLREGMGEWLQGCDICQDVCPWNHRAPPTIDPAFMPAPDRNPVDLLELFALDEVGYRARFRGTPQWRPKRRGLLRNAAIILGNQRHEPALPALIRGLNDIEPLVRAACAWALGQFNIATTRDALQNRLVEEHDALVLKEIHHALA